MIEIRNLTKIYRVKVGVTTRALDGVSVNFPETGMVFLVGKSGSGKSTLLNIIGGLDRPDEGEIIVKGRSSKDFSPSDFDSYRNTCVGFVFQEYNLLNEFSIQQNIALALQLQGKPNDAAAVEELLASVDLAGFGKRKPNTLSGGQKQRVAIARALIKEPEIILADEPTGALDSATGRQVLDTLKKLSATRLVVIVTHDREFAEFYGDRIIELSDGKIISDLSRTAAEEGESAENLRQISPGTFCIRDAARLTDEELARIGAMLRSRGGQAVITADASSLDNAKRACGISGDGTRGSFAETGDAVPVSSYDGSRTRFIRSHLPVGHAFRMGISALPKKPVRLVFTILLSVVSFVMFGIFSTLMLYNRSYSVSKALQEADYDAAVIAKNFDVTMDYVEDGEVFYTANEAFAARFSAQELELRNRDNKCGLSFAGVYYLDSYLTEERPSATLYCPVEDFTGLTDCGEAYMRENGFSLVAGRHPRGTDEAAVTEYICELYRENGFIKENSEMLGRKLELYGKGEKTVTFTVTGIYDVGDIPEKYDLLKESPETVSAKERIEMASLAESLEDMLSSSFHTLLYVCDDFYGFYTDRFYAADTAVYGSSNYIGVRFLLPAGAEENPDESIVIGDVVYTEVMLRENSRYVTYYDRDGKKTDVSPDIGDRDILLPVSCYTEGVSECRYCNDYDGSEGTLRIVGYYDMEYLTALPVVTEAFCTAMNETEDFYYSVIRTDYVREADERYDYLITLTDNSRAEIGYLLAKDEDTGSYTVLCSGIYEDLLIFITAVKFAEKIFLWIGIIMGIFAALLLFNFISVSISAKKKEMGILRAMGARGSDVFKVFYAEAGVIAMISFLLSTVFTALLCTKGNVALRSFTLIRTSSLLDFNILNVLILLAVSLFVSAVATFLPVLTAARKAPVDTIRVA